MYHRTDRQKITCRMWHGLAIRWKHNVPSVAHQKRFRFFATSWKGSFLPVSTREMKPSVKDFIFQSSDCGNGNLILTSELWVSWSCTWISEYREWRPTSLTLYLLGGAIAIQCPWTSSWLPLRQASPRGGDMCNPMADSCCMGRAWAQHCKAIILWLKNTWRDKKQVSLPANLFSPWWQVHLYSHCLSACSSTLKVPVTY